MTYGLTLTLTAIYAAAGILTFYTGREALARATPGQLGPLAQMPDWLVRCAFCLAAMMWPAVWLYFAGPTARYGLHRVYALVRREKR